MRSLSLRRVVVFRSSSATSLFAFLLWILLKAPFLKAFHVLNRPTSCPSSIRLPLLSKNNNNQVKKASTVFSSLPNPKLDDAIHYNNKNSSRRNFLFQSTTIATRALLFLFPSSTTASGLVQFPCTKPLGNTYHFMRVGETLLEEQDIWSTNPLFLTNQEAALSTKGIAQVEAACRHLKDHRIELTAGRYSLAASAMDAATIVLREFKLGRDRLIPEYTFMDPRAVGQWDMLDLYDTESAVWAMDALEAGSSGTAARPPPNEDSTPNETLEDQAVRLRQLLSVLETQYSGDSILLIFPDGTGPALLSALIAGIPLNRVHELEYDSGEVRFNVTLASTLALWQDKNRASGDDAAASRTTAYLKRIEDGKVQLAKLRAMGGDVDLVDRKDEMYEQERLVMEQEQRQREQARRERQLAEIQQRDQRRRQIEQERALKYGDSTNINGGDGVVATAALAAIAAIGAVAFGASSSSGETAIELGDDGDDDNDVATQSSPSLNGDLKNEAPPKPIVNLGLASALKQDGLAAAISSAASSTGTKRPTLVMPINGDELESAAGAGGYVVADPYVAAKTAMEEYMDRDDGGEDWLQVLSEIIQQDDNNSNDDNKVDDDNVAR